MLGAFVFSMLVNCHILAVIAAGGALDVTVLPLRRRIFEQYRACQNISTLRCRLGLNIRTAVGCVSIVMICHSLVRKSGNKAGHLPCGARSEHSPSKNQGMASPCQDLSSACPSLNCGKYFLTTAERMRETSKPAHFQSILILWK